MVPGLVRGWPETGDAPGWVMMKSTSKKFVMEWQVAGGATMVLKRTSSAKNHSPVKKKKTQKCWKKHGTFEVLSAGDTIDGTGIAQGEHQIKAKKMTCGAASNYLHQWVESGETNNGWFEADSKWGDLMFTPSQSAKSMLRFAEYRKQNFQIKHVS